MQILEAFIHLGLRPWPKALIDFASIIFVIIRRTIIICVTQVSFHWTQCVSITTSVTHNSVRVLFHFSGLPFHIHLSPRGGGGRGYLTKSYTGPSSIPRSNVLPAFNILYTIFNRNGTPFVHLLLTNAQYPFSVTYTVLLVV